MGESETFEPQQVLPQPSYGLPLQNNLETVKHYTTLEPFKLENKDDQESIVLGEIPANIKAYFWTFLSKDLVLTYLRDERDIARIMNMFEATVESFEMSLPPGRYTWDTLRDIDNLRTIVFIRIKRAWQGFERKQESTTINEYRNEQRFTPLPGQQGGGSWLGNIAGKVFGGR